MHGEKIGTAVGISERDADSHLAMKRGGFRLEFIYFDDQLVSHELRKVAVIRVGVCRRLAGTSRLVVCQ